MGGEQCTGCGATMTAGAQWCSQCYLPRQGAAATGPGVEALPANSIMSGTRQEAASVGPAPMVKTRWKKTPTTFGPVGRLVCTLLLLVPLPLMIVGTIVSGGLEIVGLGIWLLVVMPWALKDIWKAGLLPAG
ncbi:MAG TPA: hypothetical protein VHC43_09135 [Mycobacteriales bacterium]|nr:hypothetical protein [Mycobacteriales bacterium]